MEMRIRVTTIFLLVLTFCAHTSTGTPFVKLEELGYRLRHWSVDEGLPSGTVFSVAQTPDGYLWVGTRDGVARGDGRSFTRFPNPSSDNVDEPTFREADVHVDDTGQLWVVSREEGLIVRYEEGHFQIIEEAKEVPPKAGATLIRGTGSASPYLRRQIDESQGQSVMAREGEQDFGTFSGLAPGDLDAIVEDRWDETLWAVSREKRDSSLLQILQDEKAKRVTLKTPDGTNAKHYLDVFRNPDGEPMTLTDIGTFVRRDGTWTMDLRFQDSPYELENGLGCYDFEQNLWIFTQEGTYFANGDGWIRKFVELPFAEELGMGHAVRDREGSIWLPTLQGLYQFVPSEFTEWDIAPGEKNDRVHVVTQDGKNRMWFTTDEGVYFLDAGYTYFQEAPDHDFQSLHAAGRPAGGCYTSNHKGVFFQVTPKATQPLEWEGKFLGVTSEGSAWFAIARGLRRHTSPFDEAENIYLAPKGESLQIDLMVEDKRGHRFIAVRDRGLLQWDGEKPPVLRSDSPGGMLITQPIALMADPDDVIWLSSKEPSGLGYFNPDRNEWHFAEWRQLGAPSSIHAGGSLASDREGGFWVVGVSALWHCDREGLKKAVTNKTAVQWRQLDRKDGLPTVACSGHPTATCLDSWGRLWIPTSAGVALTDPVAWKEFHGQLPPPPVVISGVRLNDSIVDLNEVIVLDSGTQQLEIDFKALHFAHPDRVRFRYRLAGFHNDWNEGETLDSVRYQKLPPGSYNFEVMADNGHGIWSPSAATLALTVLPQWWESWWFRLFAFACVGAIVLGLVQWRLRLAKARSALLAEFSRELIASQESERKRVAGELHDSIGQEMLVLKGRLDMAAMKNPELKPALKGLSTDFSGTIERTRALSHDLRPPHLERLGLSESLEAKVVEIEEASKLEVNSKIEDLQPRLHPDLEIGLFRIAQEAVSNVLKHAQASRLGLQLGESDGIVTLFIDDDGQGFEPDIAKGFSLGLSGMAERAQLMGGSFKCDSSPGRGTRITVQLRRSNPSS